jgi:hypothetical protein
MIFSGFPAYDRRGYSMFQHSGVQQQSSYGLYDRPYYGEGMDGRFLNRGALLGEERPDSASNNGNADVSGSG